MVSLQSFHPKVLPILSAATVVHPIRGSKIQQGVTATQQKLTPTRILSSGASFSDLRFVVVGCSDTDKRIGALIPIRLPNCAQHDYD
jgi:hypothetical protein